MKDLLRTMAIGAADELLGSVGLTRKRALVHLGPGVMWFAAGALCGGCAALLLTPMTGDELLSKIEGQMQSAREQLRKRTNHARDEDRAARKPRAARDEEIGSA